MTAARLVLLGAAVVGALARPWRLPSFIFPVAGALIALASGLVSPSATATALRPLASPLGFLLAAIPLAVLLDRYGYFESLAGLFGSGRLLLPGLWVLGAGTVAVLNLDAAVVLLTPLYLRVARRQDRSATFLGFQPVLLALLASSFLPVSNLTNLIVVARDHVSPWQLLEHLGLPALAACVVGYFCYRFSESAASGREARLARQPAEPAVRDDTLRVVAVGSLVVALVLAGFVLGPGHGVEEWEVALGADLLLMALTRQVPWRVVPWRTALLAAGLGILAASAASDLHLAPLLTGTGPLAYLREGAVSALGANVVNNLPALLVALPAVSHAGTATCSLWPMLWGVNAGPGLLVTGTLATLLWVESMGRLGEPVTAGRFLAVGLRVALPAAIAGLLVLVFLAPAVGC